MLRTGDKIKYVNNSTFINIPLGTTFTVTDVTVQAIYMETEMELIGMKGVAKCVMSYDEYEKYFEKVVEEPKPTWTEWREITSNEMRDITKSLDYDYVIIDWLTDYLKKSGGIFETRNNGRKTDVRITYDGTSTKATSTCNTTANDKFDETKGIKVALIKLFAKRVEQFSKIYIANHY